MPYLSLTALFKYKIVFVLSIIFIRGNLGSSALDMYFYEQFLELCVRCNKMFPGWDRKLPRRCFHQFCKKCLQKRFKNYYNCPQCDIEREEASASGRRSKQILKSSQAEETKAKLDIDRYNARHNKEVKRAPEVKRAIKPIQEEEKDEAVDLQQVESQDSRADPDPA